ncbi:hypothetical protein ACROYT_G040878 [Oculina patagonica]
MRSTVVSLLVLSVLIATVSRAVDGWNISSMPGLFPPKPGNVVICNAVQDSHCNEAIKSLEASLMAAIEKKFELLIAAMNKTSQGSSAGPSFASCRDIYLNHKSQGNKAYLLQMDSGKVPVYCHMTSSGLGACGGGGWTLAMKTDGTKPTFHYDSKLWSNKIDFNLPGGMTGLDTQETKLPTYWNTHFSKICLSMRVGHQIKFIAINKHANSLYSLIADGTARIGILGNNENDCDTNDSRIGFGGGGYPDDSNTCGNEARAGGDNGDKHIKAMGYILIQ